MYAPNWPTTIRPRGSVIIGNSSCCSRMTGLIADRNSTASISKRADLSAPSMMSSVTGSTSTSVGISAMRGLSTVAISLLRRGVDQQVEVDVDARLVARQDDGRRVELGHDRGASDPVARQQLRAVVDLR